MKDSHFFLPMLLLIGGISFFLVVLSGVSSANSADLRALVETSTATFGTLLGILTAGLMFTQGKFGELDSELGEKSPDYLKNVFSMQEMQSVGDGLLAWKGLFGKLADATEVQEEKNLYRRIVARSSSMFVNVAVLLNLKLRQEGLGGTGILVSEMNPEEHAEYNEKWRALKKDWHLFGLVRQVVDDWTTTLIIPTTATGLQSSLYRDVKSSIPVLRLKESVDKSFEKVHLEVEKTLHELDGKIGKIVSQYHRDRIPQLLTQMEQARVVRGKYFYLSLTFIAAPLLVNLLILPQLAQGAMLLLRPVVAITSSLAILGVFILLLYIHKMLSV